MKPLYLLSTLVLTMFVGSTSFAQDFSNKGKDFWVGYGYHADMSFNSQDMVLYFVTEAITTVTVTIPGIGYSQTYSNIPANTVFTSNPIPKNSPQDARLNAESLTPENKGIHIISDKPIIAYAHIYNLNASGATILFPTPTLGKEYYSVNYTNVSNNSNANCWFYVVACDTGTTTVEITPSAATINHPAGVPFTINMTEGQVYNVMGQFTNAPNPNPTGIVPMGVDLTGSKIRSISSGSGSCKKIAVFSGSGRITITCNNVSSSSDNYMVQAFPKTAWGKNYLTAPTGGVMPNNFFRICILDPATVVTVNSAPIGLPLQNNFYYEIGPTKTPLLIEADKPILVAQYITSQGVCGNGIQVGDPEVIYLSPVEQNINRVLWNATPNYKILEHYFNVIIPNTGTAISSFKLDGVSIPPASFINHPQAAGYSYLIRSVTAGQHIITSDSGFNAIAYGFGNTESYGYNAGTNVRDLYQFVSVQNKYATVNFPASCRNSPFYFSMTFPYQPAQVQWIFGAALNAMGIANVTINGPVYDSTWMINGKQLYRYKLTTAYTVNVTGTYPIRVLAQNLTPEGCSGEQDIDFDLQIFDPPVADFSFTNNGCLTNPVQFTSNSTTGGRQIIVWSWDFNDGNSSNLNNPIHTYLAPGSYTVKYSLITDVGCISDTASHIVTVNNPPIAKFSVGTPYCVGKVITFSDLSTISGGAILAKWYWDFGDGTATVIANTNANQTHTFVSTGTYNVTLKVETTTGCQSTLFTIPVTIHANPISDFSLPVVCLPSGTAPFNSLSTISDGTQGSFTYQWNFGDGGNASLQNPTHVYAAAGPFNVSLTVTSNNGCFDNSVKLLNTIYAEPQAAFAAPAEICYGTAVNFTDQSTAAGSTIAQWSWDFGDGTFSTLQSPNKNYTNPGTYIVKLNVTSSTGCRTVNKYATRTVIVNPLPVADFNTSLPGCEARSITFTDASVANAGSLVKWTWDYGDGSNAVLTTGIPFNHIYTAAGSYNVSLIAETNKGCLSTAKSKQVVINPTPEAGFISPEVCLTDPAAPFIDSSKIASGNITAWSWNFGDPNANGANPNTSALQNPSHRYTFVGSYTASLIITSINGCKDTIAQSFTVNGSIPVAGFTLQNPNTLCSNKAVNIADASSVDFGSLVKAEIYWDYTNNPTIKTTDDDPLPGKIYTHSYPAFGTPATKTYSIKYVVYSGINCVNSFTKDITVLATPALQFDAINPVCSNAPSFQVPQAQLLNGLQGMGIYTGTGISSSGLFNPSAAGAGIFTIRYTYTAANSCSNYAEQTVEIYPTPVVNAGPDKVVLQGGVVTLTPALNIGLTVTYLWTPATGLNDPGKPLVVASPADDITYTLTVTTDKGCNASDQVFVKVLKAPVIPNVFSPNGDGINDKWIIAYLESYPGCTVEIYNRYGQIIYRSVGYNKPWDGTYKNKDVPAGTYYYIVDPKNGRQKMAGFVDVVR
jgi:gliding motility-associated-like protein